jgi:hypothetical protein
VLSSRVPLLPGAPDFALYKWTSGGGLTLQSRLPNGNVPTGDLVLFDQALPHVTFASDDGSVMYFALATGETGVYRRADGQTTAISVSRIVGDPTTPQPGRVMGASQDGDAVVFVSGRLLPEASAGRDNLYRYRAGDDSLTYLGTLAVTDPSSQVLGVSDDARIVYFYDGANTVVWDDGVLHTVTPENPVPNDFTSTSGRYLAWLGLDGDIHRYDAVSDSTVCVSCRADGSPGGDNTLTEWLRVISNRRPIVVNDQGAVFFTTTTRLVAADRNGSRDVYMYDNGVAKLISPGNGAFDANYADSSEDGRDVFFTTAQGLVGQDVDNQLDVYDARVGGGFPGQSAAPPAPCQKATCGPTGSGPTVSPPVVEQPRPAGAAKVRTNQTKVKVTLRKVSFTSKAMHVSFVASQRGRVRVTGSRVSTTVRNVTKAGTYSMVVPLSKKARGLWRAHRRFKLTAKLAVTGGWSTASIKINRTLRG